MWFSLVSMLALTGGAVANVLLPSLVKEHFPDRMGAMTALYTTALAIGMTAAAGLTDRGRSPPGLAADLLRIRLVPGDFAIPAGTWVAGRGVA